MKLQSAILILLAILATTPCEAKRKRPRKEKPTMPVAQDFAFLYERDGIVAEGGHPDEIRITVPGLTTTIHLFREPNQTVFDFGNEAVELVNIIAEGLAQ